MADKIPVIIDSVKDNNGLKTVVQTTLTVKATAPPHYHTLFDETINIITGEITIWSNGTEVVLTAGQSITIPQHEIHSYEVGAAETIIESTFTPGNINIEKAIKIIGSIQAGDIYTQFSTLKNNNLEFMAVIADLTNSVFVGETGFLLKKFLLTENGKKLEQLKYDLIKKYIDDNN